MDRHTAKGKINQFRLYLLTERGRNPHTTESYASDLRQWLQFCDGAGCPPYPPSPDDVAAFRRDLAAEGKARSTQQRADGPALGAADRGDGLGAAGCDGSPMPHSSARAIAARS